MADGVERMKHLRSRRCRRRDRSHLGGTRRTPLGASRAFMVVFPHHAREVHRVNINALDISATWKQKGRMKNIVELLRGEAFIAQPRKTGMIHGLADPVTAKALVALHSDPAKPWTTSNLARLCGCSRSAFNLRFTTIVGVAPMRYLQRWRIAVAKDELHSGERSIAEIASLIGFHSGGTFTRAFTRAVGCSPRRFVEELRADDDVTFDRITAGANHTD